MQRVLVTGATGFIGGHLTAALVRRGVETRCLVRSTSDTKLLSELGATLVEGNVTQADGLDEAVADVDVVFHLAGLTTALSKAEMMRANAEGAGLVAAACARRESPPTLILLSSVAAAGVTDRDSMRVETDSEAPISDYGESKRGGELAAAKFADRVPMTFVRPGIIFGPRDRLTLPIFQTIAMAGIHPVVGLGRTKLAMLYVDDLIDLLFKVAANGERLPAKGSESVTVGKGVYFAAHDRAPSYSELGTLIARAMKKRFLLLPILPPVAWTAAAANQFFTRLRGRPDAFCIDKIREARVPSWAISSEKAKSQLDWQPGAPLEDQLRDAVEWYVANDWIKVRRLLGKPK